MGETTTRKMMGSRTCFLLTVLAVSCHGLPKMTGEVVPEAQTASDLAQTMQLQHTAAFTEMSPTAFISAMASSGGSETDCRDFATETQTEISTSVTSTQATLDAIDNGDGCAQEGQTEVSTAQDRVDNAQTSLTAAQADVVTKEAAKHVACTADVNLGTMGLNALEMETCFDYTNLAVYTTIKAACTSATSALTAANQLVVTAQADLTNAQTAHAAAVTEAARLMSGCLCRVHHEQNAAWSAATSDTASHAADWKQAHEVVCALDQTTTWAVPTCPTVTKPTVANGVANADSEHCTTAPTMSPTKTPTKTPTQYPTQAPTNDDKEREFRDCNAISTGGQSAHVFFWHYGAVQPVFEYSPKSSHGWTPFGSSSVESFPNWWHSSPWSAGNPSYDIAAYVNGIKVKTYNEPTTKPALPTSAAEVDNLCVKPCSCTYVKWNNNGHSGGMTFNQRTDAGAANCQRHSYGYNANINNYGMIYYCTEGPYV